MVSLVIPLAARCAPPEQPWDFTVFATEIDLSLCYVPAPDALPMPLVLYPTARSPHYRYVGGMPFRILEAATGRVVAEATLSGASRTVLLILTRRRGLPRGPASYAVQVLDDGPLLGSGGLLIVNASGMTLSGSLNRRPLTMADGSKFSLQVGSSAVINLRARFRDRSYQAYADTIRLDQSERAVLLLLPPYYRGSLEVQSRMLLDRPPATSPPGPE